MTNRDYKKEGEDFVYHCAKEGAKGYISGIPMAIGIFFLGLWLSGLAIALVIYLGKITV